MIVKIYKPFLTVMALLFFAGNIGYAQDISVSVNTPAPPAVFVKANVHTKEVKAKAVSMIKILGADLNDNISLSESLSDLAPDIIAGISNIITDIKVEVKDDNDNYNFLYNDAEKENGSAGIKEKSKTYTKSYPLDGNDKIKLSNQYGKITVSTWDRHEVKVDVYIKAQAQDEGDAQKLLDGVKISDNKEDDLVTFRTEIEHGGGSFWNFGTNKKHKVEINYMVYMPVKTDLNVEDNYGAIELPDLDGKIKISSSYGSVAAKNMSSTANVVEGSYGTLSLGSVNGLKLDYSYGNVNIGGCNNLKADLSYGTFNMGKLTGAGEFDISYVGGFKIDLLAVSFKKLKVDASYSNVSLGIPGSNAFKFDITTTYGGFNYDDNKVSFTSKTPPDGSKHMGPTRNYKGYFGKSGDDSQLSIRTSYGGVAFE